MNRTVETIQIPDFEPGIAEFRVVPDAGQKFVDGRHAPQPAARIGSVPAQIDCADQSFDGRKHRALENAILTDKKLWPAKTRTRLQPILRKYL